MAEELLIGAAGQIADGTDIDWASMSSTLATEEERGIADELVVVARIAASHRQLHELLPVAPDTPPQLMPDRTRWGHLDLLNIVGRGSYGTVYRAWDTRLERLVALKLFHGAPDPDIVMREGRMLARVRHENIVTVYGADIIDGVAGLWMELVHGPTLEQIVRAEGPMDARLAAAIGADVARALTAVHGAGLLHCDVKAQNVVRESTGRVVLMDLGAGRPVPEAVDDTHLSDVAGTPRYMAPELFHAGASATRATDTYSFGVLLYYLASAKFPVDGKSLGELKQAHIDKRMRPLEQAKDGIPAGYLALVARAIDPDATKRPTSAAEIQAALTELAAPSATPSLSRSIGLLAAVAISVGLLVTVVVRPVFRPAAPPAPETRSIAVLPIRNLTGDAAQAFLADGLTELLIANLSRITSFRVPSFAAVASLRDADPSAEVANKLGVQILVAGTVAKTNDRIRFGLRLFDASGASIWSEETETDRANIVQAQSDVIERLVSRISPGLTRSRKQHVEQTLNPEAQDAYLRGLAITLRTPADWDQAAISFRKTTELAPNFAPAWAELALASMFRVEMSPPPYDTTLIEQIREWANRSIELDPDSGRGYAARGTVEFYYDWDLDRAEQTFRFGMAASPSDGFLRQRFAMLLAARRKLDEAIAIGLESQRLEPLVPSRSVALGGLYYYARDYARATAEYERTISINPNYSVGYFGLGRVYSAQGRSQEAIDAIEHALSFVRYPAWLGEYARVLVEAHRRADADKVLAELKAMSAAGTWLYPDQEAHLAIAEGDLERALAILQDAITRRSVSVLWMAVDPRVDPLRDDPRFARLLTQIDRQ